MNHYQKNGTLFESKNSKIVLCTIAAPKLLMFEHQLPYNAKVDRFLNFKRKL